MALARTISVILIQLNVASSLPTLGTEPTPVCNQVQRFEPDAEILGYVLSPSQGPVKSLVTFSKGMCQAECTKHANCGAVNFGPSSGNKEVLTCELVGRNFKWIAAVRKKGWTFLATLCAKPRKCGANRCFSVRPGHSGCVYKQHIIDPMSNFQIHFPRRSNKDVVEHTNALYLPRFTISFKVKIDQEGDHTYVSYHSSRSLNGILIFQRSGKLILYVQGVGSEKSVEQLYADNKWHCVVVTWDSTDGTYQMFVDNSLRLTKTGLAVGKTIEGGGMFVLGNDLDSPGGGYVDADALVGTITRVNIWDFVLPRERIVSLCKGCGFEVGNALAWPALRNTTSTYRGVSAFQEPSTCVYP